MLAMRECGYRLFFHLAGSAPGRGHLPGLTLQGARLGWVRLLCQPARQLFP